MKAKRHLGATEAGCTQALWPASGYTLALQGGPMDGAEINAYEVGGRADEVVRVRS